MAALEEIYKKAKRHLSRKDPTLKPIVQEVGLCTLRPNGNYFDVLVRSILSQQISTKAANSIYNKLTMVANTKMVGPSHILQLSDDQLKSAGVSPSKQKYLRDLASKVHEQEVQLHTLPNLPDDEVIQALLPVKGIGRWTAEMFLIFSLGRLDVLPVGDLGLRTGIQKHYHLDDLPGPEHLQLLTEQWRPFRSIATWYIWRSLGGVVPYSR